VSCGALITSISSRENIAAVKFWRRKRISDSSRGRSHPLAILKAQAAIDRGALKILYVSFLHRNISLRYCISLLQTDIWSADYKAPASIIAASIERESQASRVQLSHSDRCTVNTIDKNQWEIPKIACVNLFESFLKWAHFANI
jgi:hypothetical protein